MPEDDPLRPALTQGELLAQVALARARWRAEEDTYMPLIQPWIDRHLTAYHAALDDLERWHQAVADQTDLDLTGDTQWAAIWQVAGRCIGYARSLLILARAGHADEALPLARALHECDRLLEALADPGEQELVRRWLEDHDDRYVRPREARAAVERIEQRINEEMRDTGAEPLPTTITLTRELYHRMSVVALNRREATQSVVSEPLRTMSRGKHRSVFGRVAAVRMLGNVVEEAVTSVGDGLAQIYGSAFYRETVQPMIRSFEAIRREMPLDEASLRALD